MSRASPRAPVEILLVEDDDDDANLMVDALRQGRLPVHITVIDNGEQAIDYLTGAGADASAVRPDLVLLDLHLPRKNGHEVLAEIRRDPVLRRIPIVVLTGSDDERAFLLAYDLHANCCVPKPADQEQFAQVVARIEHFWLSVASRPGNAP